jgi:tetratricopeptide (TPR) repeat protein
MACPPARRAERANGAARAFRILALCLSSLSLTAAAAPTAKGYLDEGLRLYNDGRYEDAIRELRLGYALEPLPAILYTLGQSARKLGRCDEAIGYYRQYLRSADATSAGAARFQIERCEQQQREAREAQAREAQARAAAERPPVPATPTPPPPPRRPFYRDALGMSLAGVGVGGALAGAGLLIAAPLTVQHSRASLQQFDDALGRAQTMRTAGIVLVAGGGALVIAGVIRLALVARGRAGGAR